MRPIDADELKDKLQQHHDFWVMAWGGFSKMPISDKKRVDEITSCIAEVVNAPTIEPKRGEWIDKGWNGDWQFETDGRGNCWHEYECSECGFHNKGGKSNFCPNCGADMRNCSEKPNNCENHSGEVTEMVKDEPQPCEWCKFYDGENCFSQEPCKVMLYFKDEPQTDCGDFADRLAYERGVKHAWKVAQKVFNSTVTFYEAEDVAKQIDKDINVRSKDEPQTDCAWK